MCGMDGLEGGREEQAVGVGLYEVGGGSEWVGVGCEEVGQTGDVGFFEGLGFAQEVQGFSKGFCCRPW